MSEIEWPATPFKAAHAVVYDASGPDDDDVEDWRHVRGRAAARFRRWAKRRQKARLFAYVDLRGASPPS